MRVGHFFVKDTRKLISIFISFYRTYCREICPGLKVICQVSFSPWDISRISFLELAFAWVRYTATRLFHKTDSREIQNAALFKAIERLKVSYGCSEILVITFGG